MGGGGQANSGQASQAASQQSAASAAEMKLAQDNSALQKRMVGMLFGSGAPGSSGSLSQFMDPKSLNQKGLNSNYQTQFNEGSDQLGRDYSNQRGALAQSFANSGATASSTPNGFQADQMRKLGSSNADSRGALYSTLKGGQYSDALNNFWNANNIASGNAATAVGAAGKALGDAGSSSASIYNTAGQYHASPMAGVLGSALQAGGAVGAGAASACPCEGSLILMADGLEKAVEFLQIGDGLRGIDGNVCTVEQITVHLKSSITTETENGSVSSSSLSHAFVTEGNGFLIAFEAFGGVIATRNGFSRVVRATLIGQRRVFDIRTDGVHSYRADGIWAWGVGDVPSDKYLELPDVAAKLAEVAQ